MNLIACDQNCRHQQDGYCALNRIAQITSGLSGTCGYFEETQKERKAGSSAKNAENVEFRM